MPALPAAGETGWDDVGQAMYDAATEVVDGRLSVAAMGVAFGEKADVGHTHDPVAPVVGSDSITDATVVGKAVLTAADAPAARAAIGAGTSSLTVGTTAGTAKAGDYAPPDSTTSVKGLVELATTGEATTGTDDTRAVTPAGLAAVAATKRDRSPGYLSTVGACVELAIDTVLEAADSNFFYNGDFQIWPHNSLAGDTSIAVSADGDANSAGGWHSISHNGGPATTVSKLHAIKGGIRHVLSFTAANQYHYLRQFIPDPYAMEGRRFTLCADVETSGTVDVDVYVQARVNTADGDRVLVIDTAQLTLSGAGRRLVACCFDFPDLDATTAVWDDRAMVEAAFRFRSTGSGSRTGDVRWITLVPGREARAPGAPRPAVDRAMVQAYYETGFAKIAGLESGSGQKGVPVVFQTKKELPVVVGDITLIDLAGNVGRVSTYDLAGARTDNVAYSAIQGDTNTGDTYRNGFTVLINGSTASGIACVWIVDNY